MDADTLWFKTELTEDAGHITVESMVGDNPTGAAVCIPFDAVPFLVSGMLALWADPETEGYYGTEGDPYAEGEHEEGEYDDAS